jgi:hypothetical protein
MRYQRRSGGNEDDLRSDILRLALRYGPAGANAQKVTVLEYLQHKGHNIKGSVKKMIQI